MRLCLFSAFAICTSVAAVSVDSYISTEGRIAKNNLLANIGPHGAKAKAAGAFSGVVIASPSTENPNYLYQWCRDASLVFKVIIDQYTQGVDSSLRGLIDDFVGAQAVIQQLTNPSGTVSTGGLGEPKFYINETAFDGPWGRPQRDGPALRSTALITYANWLLDHKNATFVENTLWSIIKLDLDYISANWNQSTFDLWEEIQSSSFFTTAVQHRSLRQGVALASRINQTAAVSGYPAQADNVLCFLQSYWNQGGSYITSNTGGERSGIDANSALASIHTFDAAAGCDVATFQPCSDKALASLKTYIDSFRSIYVINNETASNAAVATGRYPEDVYQGGNPWYLTTAAVAEQLYDSLIVWSAQGSLTVTSTSLPFFQQFLPHVTPGFYNSRSSTYTTLTKDIKAFADGFIAVNAKYTPPNGGLAEQFSRTNGTPVSAVDLTWSYASALTAFAAREGTKPASWGAKGLVVPSVCVANPGPTVNVTFNVNATTVQGENIYLTGSVVALQSWSTNTALELSPTQYPVWSITVAVPASTNIEYKYIRVFNGAVTWESDPNLSISTPANGTMSTNDAWR